MTSNDDYVLEILIDEGMVTKIQQAAIVKTIEKKCSILELLVRLGILSKVEVMKFVANKMGMDFVSISNMEINEQAIQKVPFVIAKRYGIMPLSYDNNVLTVAIKDPLNVEILDSLVFLIGCDVKGKVAEDFEINVALDKYYGKQNEREENNLNLA